MQLSANETAKISKNESLPWDWTAAGLLLACVIFSSGRLVVTDSTKHLLVILWLAVLGCMFGLVLGASRFRGRVTILLSSLYMAFFLPRQLGLAMVPSYIDDWGVRLQRVSERFTFAIDQLVRGENVDDPILFLVGMGIIFWWLGSNAGYRLKRYADVWGATLPLGLIALLVHTYDGRPAWKVWLLGAFMLFLLLLVARVNLIKKTMLWESTRTLIPQHIRADLQSVSVSAAFLLVFLAWATPALPLSFDTVESVWAQLTSRMDQVTDPFGRALNPLQGAPGGSGNYYGDRISLGRGTSLSPVVLFNVQVLAEEQPALRYFWRDRVYDHYKNGQWSLTLSEKEQLNSAEMDFATTEDQSRSLSQFLIQVDSYTTLLHLPAQPLQLDRSAEVSYGTNPNDTLDVAAFVALVQLEPGESYIAAGWLPVASATELRAAGSEYPSWIVQRYLQVPPEITERTRQLAREIAEGLENPYDISLAMSNYLRRNIEYADQLPLTLSGAAEPLDWFLFDHKKGYCNYYASAQVIMLRTLGIPARLAVGYAQGDSAETLSGERFTVRGLDAHAWPEVYFPGYGWVEFEPTANQPALVRPLELTPQANAGEPGFDGLIAAEPTELPFLEQPQPEIAAPVVQQDVQVETNYWSPIIMVLSMLLLGTALLWNRHRSRGGAPMAALIERGFTRFDIKPPRPVMRWARLAELSALARAYMQINISLARLGAAPKRGHTPGQRAAALGEHLPTLQPDLLRLSRAYQRSLYGRANGASKEKERGLTWRMRLATFVQIMRRKFTQEI